MKRLFSLGVFLALTAGCARQKPSVQEQKPGVYGLAIVVVSGEKQVAGVGSTLAQPLVVQVNDKDGNGINGALVTIAGPTGSELIPASGPTDSSGQFTTEVRLGAVAGRYRFTASTRSSGGKVVDTELEEIALGWQETLGRQLNRTWCERCHNPESTPERVSNYDNLSTKPHAFTEGAALNKLSDADLTAIISHGGAAINASPEMPPYGYTLSSAEIQALIAYIRAMADPPYHSAGTVDAEKQR